MESRVILLSPSSWLWPFYMLLPWASESCSAIAVVDYYAESQAVQSSVASGKLRGRALSVHVFLDMLNTLTSIFQPRKMLNICSGFALNMSFLCSYIHLYLSVSLWLIGCRVVDCSDIWNLVDIVSKLQHQTRGMGIVSAHKYTRDRPLACASYCIDARSRDHSYRAHERNA